MTLSLGKLWNTCFIENGDIVESNSNILSATKCELCQVITFFKDLRIPSLHRPLISKKINQHWKITAAVLQDVIYAHMFIYFKLRLQEIFGYRCYCSILVLYGCCIFVSILINTIYALGKFLFKNYLKQIKYNTRIKERIILSLVVIRRPNKYSLIKNNNNNYVEGSFFRNCVFRFIFLITDQYIQMQMAAKINIIFFKIQKVCHQ